jgi:hypothetical protein
MLLRWFEVVLSKLFSLLFRASNLRWFSASSSTLAEAEAVAAAVETASVALSRTLEELEAAEPGGRTRARAGWSSVGDCSAALRGEVSRLSFVIKTVFCTNPGDMNGNVSIKVHIIVASIIPKTTSQAQLLRLMMAQLLRYGTLQATLFSARC